MIPIVTERLVLRPFRTGDEDDLVREANDPKVVEHLRDRFPHPYTRADAELWIAAGAQGNLLRSIAITLDDRVIGGIGVELGEDVHRLCGEVGYWLGVNHWGRGYVTEAVAAFCEHLFAETPLERLFATVHEGNDASVRVLEKTGFVLEGTARRAVVKRGVVKDMYWFARLRP